ncbi:hypothetical protein KAX03_03110 [Candidatus Bathyarchaeota archaeon]|nr:hypothetical protein [Candidatus Bathyarchaeota archaeon]
MRSETTIHEKKEMSTEPIEKITKKIIKQYNRSPEGWNVLSDRKGNIIVIGPSQSYWLRIISLGPNNYTGAGIKIDSSEKIERIVKDTPQYGLRPLSKNDLKKLLDTFQRNGTTQSKIVERILSEKPKRIPSIQKIRPEAILTGPILTHPDLSSISSSQRELERKLKRETEKLFRERYPSRSAIYT